MELPLLNLSQLKAQLKVCASIFMLSGRQGALIHWIWESHSLYNAAVHSSLLPAASFLRLCAKEKKPLLFVKALRPFHLVLTSTVKKRRHFSDVAALPENNVCYAFIKMSLNSFEFQLGSAPRNFSVGKIFKIKSGLWAALISWLILKGFDLDMTRNAILHHGKWPQMTTYTSTFPVLPVFSINHHNIRRA